MPRRRSFDTLISWFLPESILREEPDVLRRAKLSVAYNLTVPLWGPPFAVFLWKLEQPVVATLVGVGTVCAWIPLVVLRRTGSLVAMGHLLAAYGTGLVVGAAWLEGGLGAPGVLWFPVVPLVAMLIAGRGAAILWAGVMAAALVAFWALERRGVRVVFTLDESGLALLRCTLAIAAISVFVAIGFIFESLKMDALRSLEEANRALAGARDQAEAATRTKSEFLATMSHEIRTPLHGIFGMTELALDTNDEGERRDFILRSRTCAETLMTIINDILDFSRIEAGKLDLERTAFDVRAVVDAVLDTLAVEVGRKGLELVGCVDDAVPARVWGDPGRLRQILINLAANAVKFTERGAVVVRVEGVPETADGGASAVLLRATVRDSGIGIPGEKQTAIFEAFAQADSSTTRRYGGTGLGLAITQRLVGLMGGSVTLESEPGAGSTFTVTMRLGVAAPPPLPVANVRGLRVLVVDGSGASRAHLRHTLAAWGCECTLAAGGDEATAALARAGRSARPFDVVLVDRAMAEPSGTTTAARLAGHPGAAGLPLIVLVPSGAGVRRDDGTSFAAAVSKPLKSGALLAALASMAGPDRRVGEASGS